MRSCWLEEALCAKAAGKETAIRTAGKARRRTSSHPATNALRSAIALILRISHFGHAKLLMSNLFRLPRSRFNLVAKAHRSPAKSVPFYVLGEKMQSVSAGKALVIPRIASSRSNYPGDSYRRSVLNSRSEHIRMVAEDSLKRRRWMPSTSATGVESTRMFPGRACRDCQVHAAPASSRVSLPAMGMESKCTAATTSSAYLSAAFGEPQWAMARNSPQPRRRPGNNPNSWLKR